MYLAVARSAIQTRFAYRGEVWTHLFFRLLQVFAKIAIWTAVYAGASSVNGVTLPQMVTYAIISSTLLDAWFYPNLIKAIDRSLKSGDVAVYLLKPLSYPLYLFAIECGNFANDLVIVMVPTIVIVVLFNGLLPPASLAHGLLFVGFWMESLLILFLIAALFGLAAFWLMTAFSLEWLLQGILAIFSGSFIPFWFFPEPLGSIARHLPFAWIGYYPTAVYLGRLPPDEAGLYLGLGGLWVLALIVGVWALWRRASLRLTVQGG